MGGMDWIEAIFLGFVQGVTEFIPVSSSGHLEIAERLIGSRGADFHFFLELINFGTLLALMIFFRKRIWGILERMIKHRDWKLARNVIITSMPAGVAGFLLAKVIEQEAFFSTLVVIAGAMGVIGVLMIIVDKLPQMSRLKSEEELTGWRALWIGLAQVLALVPGTSRSGSTIVAGRLVGMNAKSATEYSFLVSIPVMVGVCLKAVVSKRSLTYIGANWQTLLVANVVAFGVGLVAVRFVMNFVKREDSLKFFGWYRVAVAGGVILASLVA